MVGVQAVDDGPKTLGLRGQTPHQHIVEPGVYIFAGIILKQLDGTEIIFGAPSFLGNLEWGGG